MAELPRQHIADVIDVHLLDLAAQIEALMREVRHIQRAVLRVRGVVPPAPEVTPAKEVQGHFANLLRGCDALRDAAESGAATAATLTSGQTEAAVGDTVAAADDRDQKAENPTPPRRKRTP
jgi:hypothetical protein